MLELIQLKSVFGGIVISVYFLLAWLIFSPILPIVTLFYIFKTCVILMAKVRYPQLRPLSSRDCCFAMDKLAVGDHVQFDYQRIILNNISFIFKFRESNRTELNLKEIEQKFQYYIDKTTAFNWKLKCYLVRICGYSFFQEIPNFSVSGHIRKAYLSASECRSEYWNEWIAQPYSFKSALWELLILEHRSECFLALKMHHTIADGISATQILDEVLGLKQHPRVEEYRIAASPSPSILEMIHFILAAPARTLEHVLKTLQATDPFKMQNTEPLLKQFMSTSTLNVKDVKSIARFQGVSFNAVLLTIYSRALQKLPRNKRAFAKPATEFLISVAQPQAGRPKDFIGNLFSVLMVFVPLNISDPVYLLRKVQERMTHIQTSELSLVYRHVFLKGMSIFPVSIQNRMKNAPKLAATSALSPMLAADSYTMYDGNIVESAYILTGITVPIFGLLVTPFSFNRKLVWTFVGSSSSFEKQEDLDLFANEYISEAFEELLSVTHS